MDNQEQPHINPEDPSVLLPTMPKFKMGKKALISIFVVVLVGILAILHFSLKTNTPIETTRDTPNGGVVTITPSSNEAPGLVPEIVTDKDGREYLTGELIVVFRSSVPIEEAKKTVASAGGVVKQHFTQFPVFLVGISEGGAEGVNKAILKFQTMPGVERAEPNYLTKATP